MPGADSEHDELQMNAIAQGSYALLRVARCVPESLRATPRPSHAFPMKIVSLLAIGLVALQWVGVLRGYEDVPMGLSERGVALIASYEAQARSSLPHFDEERANPGGRVFFVVTKIFEKDVYEQVYVKVETRTGDFYTGRIASEPIGPVTFKKGAEITVPIRNVVDWCILMPNGEEEGNLAGKAMDALRAGVLVVVVSMKPDNGTFAEFRVVEVRNPRTKQAVADLVPKDVIAKIEESAKSRWGKTKAEHGDEKFAPLLVEFPEWKIVEK